MVALVGESGGGKSRPEAGDSAISATAVAADAAGFIEALPEGCDTVIGKRGFRLSGGPRRQLSLALLKNPELLIFDEATSCLDSPSEARILPAVDRFAKGRTVHHRAPPAQLGGAR
ncbi:MAG: hypothetical protein WCI65_06850 [Synechococcaceae cyanobacterium ELA263]